MEGTTEIGGNHYEFKIQKILLKNGMLIKPCRINVFVGANNCGKTRLLKEISEYILGNIGNKILLQRLSIPGPKTWIELNENYRFEIINTPTGKAIRHSSPSMQEYSSLEHFGYDLEDEINNALSDNSNWDHLRSRIGKSLLTFLDTDSRLNLVKSRQADIYSEGPGNLLETLYYANSDKTNKLNEYCWKIFRKRVFLSPYSVGKVELKIGYDFSAIPSDPQDARDRLTNVPGLDEQGDGMRSAIGIIAALCAVKKPIVLLDEPEAFLHPPQAMQLGEIIGELIDSTQQLFIATHSADFLRGLLSKTQDANIVHINRASDDIVTANVLDADTLKQIITNPLLSSSRVLEGLFYKGVVVTEGDADTVFYQRAFQMVGSADEIHFINAHNKQTLKKVILPYQKLGIKFALIADADVLREKRDIEEILKVTDDSELKKRIFVLQEKLIGFFTAKSRYDVLLELREAIRKFVTSDDMTIENEDTEKADSMLFNIRKRLKAFHEESDILRNLKRQGRNALDKEHCAYFDKLWEDCANVGFFIVPVGELESWLIDYGIARYSNKSKWISEALNKLFEIDYDEEKELWKFIGRLQKYLTE